MKAKTPRHKVGIEVSRSSLSMVVIEQKGTDLREIRGHQVEWLQEAGSLNDEEGMRELAAALSTLVSREKLHGAPVHIAMSSDFCVTRVAAGETDKVRAELRNLRDRSNQYLLLGPGEKAVARSLRSIDAKQSQGWLTVTNQGTVENVLEAAQQAGLQVDFIEHAMVAMCRAVGQMRRDTDAPVIIVESSQSGVDLGISYRGQLLFDYRPGGMNCKNQIGAIVQRHLERIQRYCNRHFGFATGRISQVFICGDPADLAEIREQFAAVQELSAEILDPRAILPDCTFQEEAPAQNCLAAAIGTALVDKEELARPAETRGICDLMDFMRSVRREPLIPALTRTAWPIAAALLLAVGIFTLSFVESRKAASLERQQQKLDADKGRVSQMKIETLSAATEVTHLQRIQSRLRNPAWHNLMTLIGRSMPEPVWLESIQVEHDGSMTIVGPSRTQDAIFDFVRYLEKIPHLDDVRLESQLPVTVDNGPAIRFDIKCRFNDRNDLVERTASNG